MKTIWITIATGVFVGLLDIVPMLKLRMDKYSILSAFLHYFTLPFIIFNTNLFRGLWWLQGGVVSFILALPTIILVARDEKNSILPMTTSSLILGITVSAIHHFLL